MSGRATITLMGIKRLCVFLMVFVCGFSYIASTQAQLTFGSKWGHVMARAVVRDESGQPIIVEFDDQGYEIREVTQLGQYQNDRNSLLILQAEEYRFHRQRLEDFNSTYEQTLAADARLMTVPQFMSGTYPTADNSANIAPQRPPQNIKSVLVRGQSNRIVNDPSQLILLAFPLDMVNSNVHVSDDARSIVVSPEGLVLYASNNTIGYRTGFFGDPNERQDPFAYLGRVDKEDEIFGPVAGARVTVSDVYPGGTTVSGQDGRYSMTYILPTCPLGGFEYTTDLYVELNYRNFMPYGSPVIPYYLRSQAWDFCYASLMPAGPFGLIPVYVSNGGGSIVNLNMYVDVMFVSGHIKLANQAGDTVPLANSTSYRAFDQEEENTLTQIYDFNGDGQNDYVAPGAILNQRMVDGACASILDEQGQVVEAFVRENEFCSADTEANMQGIWFDIQNKDPDLVRVMDKQKRIEDIGMLATISAEDYKNTDILVFRESTGQLVMERRGLPSQEVEGSRQAVAYDENEQQVSYRVMLRGPRDRDLNIGGASRAGGFEEWAARSYMTEPFSVRQANHLKPGEYIKIVAINRSTGYIGTARVQLTTQSGGNIGIAAETITMRPPNLKIWAEREYDIEHGLTPDDERYRHYIVGAEGASLTSDATVTVYTEWLDHDGSALPEGLGDDNGEQYGLTGRLARIVSEGVLRSVAQSDLAEFPIAPGRQTQALRVASNQELAEHFYLHVIGKPRDQECGQVCPNFEDTGASIGAAPPFDTRPRFLTPFYVPLFDEQKHWREYNAYRQQQRNFDTDNPTGVEPQKPLPAYAWKYRPEYQFSRFELEMQAINQVEEDQNGSATVNVLEADTPIIANTHSFIEALYSLVSSQIDRLMPIDGEQKLVITLGEDEQLIEVGENRTIRFENISHLASLDVEDYLSMRLYTNNDAGNILWEWAFEHIVLDTQLSGYDSSSGNTLYVTADNPVVPLQARVLGYANRSEELKEPLRVLWGVSGAATLEVTTEDDDDQGVFFNEVSLSPIVTGVQSRVSFKLVGPDQTELSLPPFEVIPGAPAEIIQVDTPPTTLSVDRNGQRTLTFIIRDQHGNQVVDGTGVAFFTDGSVHVVSSDNATQDGQASVTVTGGEFAGPAQLRIQVAEQTHTVDLEIHPLQIQIASDNTIFAGQSRPLTVVVTDIDDQPISGAEVKLGSTYGFVEQSSIMTNSNGQAETIFTAPGSRGQGEITAQVGRSTMASKSVAVDYPSTVNRDLEVGNAVVVGDAPVPGVVEYTRYDGETIGVPFSIQETIRAQGQNGDTVTVTIGDIHDPNLPPISAYYMNRLYQGQVEDDTGRYTLRARQVYQSDGTRLGGGSSFRFDANQAAGASKLWADSTSDLARLANTGFAIEVFPHGESGGDIVNLGQGGQALSYANMRFSYQVTTDGGTATVTSAPVMPGRWHQIAARYHGGQIELWVNDQVYSQVLTGSIVYSWTGNSGDQLDNADVTHDLTIGGQFTGRLNSLKWYDWTAQPVLTFENGATQTTVNIDSSGYRELVIRGTGNLHANDSMLGLQRVAIHTNNVRQYASLVSTETFRLMAEQYTDTLAPDAPPINVAGLYSYYDSYGSASHAAGTSRIVSIFIPNAYAFSLIDFAWGLVNFIIPIEDIGIVLQQMAYAVTDPDKFEPDEFVISLINVVTIFPPAKPLRLITAPLRALFRSMKVINPRFVRYFGGVFGGVMNRAKRGDFDLLWHVLPFLVIAAEMYNDPEARKGLEFMVSSVNSGEDLLTWIEYMALPGEGWDGQGQPPEVDAFAEDPTTGSVLSFLVPEAHAQSRILRVAGVRFGRMVAQTARKMSKGQAKDLSSALRVLVREAKQGDIPNFAKYLHSPSTLQASAVLMAKGGQRSLVYFVRGRNNARFSMPIILSTIAYLGWEIACGEFVFQEDPDGPQPGDEEIPEDLACEGKGLNSQVSLQVGKKMATAFADAAAGSLFKEESPDDDDAEFTLNPSGHGALFHLVQTAYFQLNHRFANGMPIKFMEKQRWVTLSQSPINNDSNIEIVCKTGGNCIGKYSRNVDIVLGEGEIKFEKGSFRQEAFGSPEEWIELKSWAAKGETGNARYEFDWERRFGKMVPWIAEGSKPKESGKTNWSAHKQFNLDRAAAFMEYAWLPKNEAGTNQIQRRQAVSDFSWRFQGFRVRRNNQIESINALLGGPNTKGSFAALVNKCPEIKAGVKNSDSVRNFSFGPDGSAYRNAKIAKARDIVGLIIRAGFVEIEDAVDLDDGD